MALYKTTHLGFGEYICGTQLCQLDRLIPKVIIANQHELQCRCHSKAHIDVMAVSQYFHSERRWHISKPHTPSRRLRRCQGTSVQRVSSSAHCHGSSSVRDSYARRRPGQCLRSQFYEVGIVATLDCLS